MIKEQTPEDKIGNIAENVQQQNDTANQFAVAQVPYHTHNGSDSPRVSFGDLVQRIDEIKMVIPGTLAQTAGNYGVFYIAQSPCVFLGAQEVHSTAEATATTFTIGIEKLVGTTASGSGTSLLQTPFSLKATANVVRNGNKAALASTAFSLKKGDRLGFVATTTGSSPANVTQVVLMVNVVF